MTTESIIPSVGEDIQDVYVMLQAEHHNLWISEDLGYAFIIAGDKALDVDGLALAARVRRLVDERFLAVDGKRLDVGLGIDAINVRWVPAWKR